MVAAAAGTIVFFSAPTEVNKTGPRRACKALPENMTPSRLTQDQQAQHAADPLGTLFPLDVACFWHICFMLPLFVDFFCCPNFPGSHLRL